MGNRTPVPFLFVKMKKGVIFDMDGTVWDSSENVARSWTVKVLEAGYKDKIIKTDDIKNVMGNTMDVIADILFPYAKKGPERDRLKNSCQEYELEYLREHGGQIYDGITQTWRALKDMGYHNYIVSNCQAGYIECFLAYYGIPYGKEEDLIEDIECFGNNGLQKDANIRLLAKRNSLTDACYVGDIQGDYDATLKAGYKFIHARYGFGSIDTDVPYIKNFSDLTLVVPRVIG